MTRSCLQGDMADCIMQCRWVLKANLETSLDEVLQRFLACLLQIQAMLDTYASKYHDLKAPRKLKWRPASGSVSLTIRVGGGSLDLTVTPLHATVIMHFQVITSLLHCFLPAAPAMPAS